MIVTTIDKLDFYSEIPYSKDIMDFIENFKKTDMKPDRYDIHGDDLFAAVSRYDTEPREQRKFESHRKYIDLQIVLDGSEEMDWAPIDSLNMTDNGFATTSHSIRVPSFRQSHSAAISVQYFFPRTDTDLILCTKTSTMF